MVIEYLTGILIFVTAIYVYLTHKMVEATESSVQAINEQSEALQRPYVVVEPFVRPNTPFLYLRIKNTGKTSAQDLTLKTSTLLIQQLIAFLLMLSCYLLWLKVGSF